VWPWLYFETQVGRVSDCVRVSECMWVGYQNVCRVSECVGSVSECI